jgi:radical SAM-linked protein
MASEAISATPSPPTPVERSKAAGPLAAKQQFGGSIPPIPPKDKVRIHFRKVGLLRLLSHHDLMRTFERILRRADLPVHCTQGFHPKSRLVFALSLPLGVVGRDEVADLELSREISPEEVHTRLALQVPPGLEIISVRRIPLRGAVRVHGLSYALTVPEQLQASLRSRITQVLASASCWIDRTRPPRRRLDIRPYLRDLRLEQDADESGTAYLRLVMDLWLLPSGTARPEEVLQLLELQDLLESGAVLERTRLELDDEQPSLPAAPHRAGLAVSGDWPITPKKVAHEEGNAD